MILARRMAIHSLRAGAYRLRAARSPRRFGRSYAGSARRIAGLSPQSSQSFDCFSLSDSPELTMQMLLGAQRFAFIVVIRFIVVLFLQHVLRSRLGNRL